MTHSSKPVCLSTRCLDALFEEYRSLSALLVFRLNALERRIPLIGASLSGVLVSLFALPAEGRVFLLFAVPVALIWFLRTTVTHARALEDLLRRIDAIERSVNERIGERVMRFQSSHPSRKRFVGGRTSRESIAAVAVWCVVLLAACGALSGFRGQSLWAFGSYLITVFSYGVHLVIEHGGYRYRPSTDAAPDG